MHPLLGSAEGLYGWLKHINQLATQRSSRNSSSNGELLFALHDERLVGLDSPNMAPEPQGRLASG